MTKRDVDHRERLETAAKARLAMLAKAAAISPKNAPDYAERQAERLAISQARDQRKAEVTARKAAEHAQRLEEQAAAARAAHAAAEALKAEQALEAERAAEALLVLMAEQKKARDARYAARKAARR